MKQQSILDIEPFLQDFALQTEKIIGAIIIKKGVKISDTTQKNIIVNVLKTVTGFDIEFAYRVSLRFADMGVGKGYHKGTKITVASTEKFKVRRKKNIVNRPSFARAHLLEEALAVEIETIAVESLASQFKQLAIDPRQKAALLVRHIQRTEGGRPTSKTRKMFSRWL